MSTLQLNGKYNTADVFTNNIEETAISQIIGMLNEPITENTKVAIMPDVHAGKGSTVGTTIKLPENKNEWKVCPNVVGVDIGCSMRAVQVDIKEPDLQQLDDVVNTYIPSGFSIHERTPLDAKERKKLNALLKKLSFKLDDKRKESIIKSCGTLGGGNHYVGATRF